MSEEEKTAKKEAGAEKRAKRVAAREQLDKSPKLLPAEKVAPGSNGSGNPSTRKYLINYGRL